MKKVILFLIVTFSFSNISLAQGKKGFPGQVKVDSALSAWRYKVNNDVGQLNQVITSDGSTGGQWSNIVIDAVEELNRRIDSLIAALQGTLQIDTVQLYAILEKDFTQSGIYDNVYTDVDADVILTSPTAVVDTLPMFWDGGNTWKFRFSPNEAGTWTWRTVSADGGLNNKSGTFVCVSSSNEGSIAADATYPYHFKRQNGENFWFMGDTQWNLFRTIPYDSLNTETVKDYIDLRYAQGYNVVHFVTNTDEQWYDVDQDDPDSINLTFFQNGDERLAYLNSKGMIGGLLISWGRERGDGTWRDWDNFTTDENKIRYMRYVVARYSAYNIYWILSGEYDESLTADFDYLGEQLKRYDPHQRMIALHPGGAGSSEIYADTDWMTIADYRQTVTETEDVHAALLSSRDHNKPVVFSEYGYYMCDRDSNGQVDHIYEIMPWTRRMAWNAAMAGGYFITGYGATVLGGLRDDWAFTNMDDPKYDDWEQQVGYIKSFFEDLDYWRLTPNDALITSGSGTHHLLYEDDSVYVVYAYLEGSTFQVNLSSAAGVYAGTRLDPVTGSTVSIGNYNGGGTITVSVPDTNDYVYMFRRTSSSGYITQTDTLYINNYADDGYVISNGTFNNGSDEDGTMTFGNYTDLLYTMFLRFSNFQAPQGATITSAKIYLTANGDRTGTVCNGNIYFCDTSSSAQITSKADLDARSITSAVAWNSVPAWYDGTVNSSPELKTILQTVVDRYDWSEGNAVQIFIKDYGSSTDARRRANARTPLSNYNTAFLVVTYEYGDAPPPPPVYEDVYYVDNVNGSNANDGKSPSTAWKTISKVNSVTLSPGDTILLHKDQVWYEMLEVTESGTSGSSIVFGAYGTGSAPKLSHRSELSGWNNPSNWTVFDADVYIWRFALPSTQLSAANWTGLWLDGQYYKRAYNIYTNNFPFDSTSLDYQDTDTYPGIDNNYRWFVNSACTYLYLYSVNNPATEYNMIEANIRITDPAYWHNVKGNNSNYVTLDGLSFEGGFNSIYLDNCSSWEIKNCYSEFAPRALMLTGGSNNNYIHNNHFRSGQDSLANGDMAYYGSGILALFNGVYLWTSASNNIIYGNLIEDFPNGAFHFGTPSTSGSVNWNLIDSNYIKMNIRSGRFLGMYGDNGVPDYMKGNVLVRNFVENQRQGDNWVGDSTVLAFNIYNTVQPQAKELYGAWGKVSQGGGVHSYYGNNTFYNTRKEALYPEQGYSYGRAENNLFINCNTSLSIKYAVNMYAQSYNQHQTWDNNLLFYDGKGSSDYLVLYNGSYYTVSGWNSSDAGDDNISNNFQHTGSLSALIDTDDFSYPSGSPALNSGTDAPSWVKTKILQKFPNGFYRRDGTQIWNAGGTRVNTDVGAGGK